jgi:hypothetical protein
MHYYVTLNKKLFIKSNKKKFSIQYIYPVKMVRFQ